VNNNEKNIERNSEVLDELSTSFTKSIAKLTKIFDDTIAQVMEKFDQHCLIMNGMQSE
jgi:hypothetical protein